MRRVLPLIHLALCAAMGLMLGEVPVTLQDLCQGLTGRDGPGALTVRMSRVPRILVAVGRGPVWACRGRSLPVALIWWREPPCPVWACPWGC
jgi:iron complex transport system permease protein